MECVVQGIIETQHVEALGILLEGLCGVPKEHIKVHELCLKSGPNLGSEASEVRLLCDLEQPEPSWTVRHVGGSMRGAGADQISVLVRTMVESKVSKNVLRLFYLLGYKLDHELLRVGTAFKFQRGAQITVTVVSVSKMLKLHAIDDTVPVTPGCCICQNLVLQQELFQQQLQPLHLSCPLVEITICSHHQPQPQKVFSGLILCDVMLSPEPA